MIEKLGVRLYTATEVAEQLGVHPCTIKAMVRDGRLDPVRIGVRSYFPEEQIRAFILGERPATKPKWPSRQRKGGKP